MGKEQITQKHNEHWAEPEEFSIQYKSNHIPRVSVITTSYNAEKTIGEAIESILVQTFGDFEYIIVDDGSMDHTVDNIKNHEDSRIRLIEQEHRGRVLSLNHAVRLTRGEFVANLDADDIALPMRLQKQVDFLESHPEVALLGTFGIELNETSGKERKICLPITNEDIRNAFAFYCPFIHSSVMVRRFIFKSVGFYNEQLMHSEDLELWIRIAAKHTVANLSEYLVKKRIHSRQSFKILKEDIRFVNEARLGWKAAHTLSLPSTVKLHALLFFLYTKIPLPVRNKLKTFLPQRSLRLISDHRGGWEID